MQGRTLLVFPPSDLEHQEIARALLVTRRRFGGSGAVLVAGRTRHCAAIAAIAGCEVIRWPPSDAEQVPEADTHVFVDGYEHDSYLDHWRYRYPGPLVRRTYRLHTGTRLQLVSSDTYDSVEYPLLDAHVFNRLARRKNGYMYHPYGPTLSDVELGEVNEFGFRVPRDYMRLAQRPADHKVVAVFGGSSTFSFHCLDDEMFPHRLEVNLNAACATRPGATTFSVLNFGMHDNVVLQEAINYLVYVASVRPDVVIAHDGHNDMYYGLQSDPLLLNDFGIAYQRLHEEWAKLVQGTQHVPTPDLYSVSLGSVHQTNLPPRVIDAYLARKHQFMSLAHASGAAFIWGIQPLHSSKRALSPREVMKSRHIDPPPSPDRVKWQKRLYQLYEMLSDRLAREPGIDLVDFHRAFGAYDERHELFWDYCHTSPAGDEVIAEAYVEPVLRALGGGARRN